MRKRIVIGLLIVSVIGIAAFFFSQPKKGTVEWHKSEYLAASGGAVRPNLVKSTLGWFVGLDQSVLQNEERERVAQKAESHRAALVKLGYLSERRFAITNRTFNEFLKATLAGRSQLSRGQPSWAVRESVAPTNVLVVTGLPEIVSQYDALIRKADVP